MKAWALALLCAGAHAVASAAAGPVAVALKASATAMGPNILLGEVVEGLPPEAALQSLKPSGQPGTATTVDAALVALRLRRAPGGPYQLGGAPRSEVRIGLQELPGRDLRTFAHDYLAARLSGVAGAEISPLGGVADLRLYAAPVRLQVAPLEEGQLRGNVVLRVRVLQEGPGGLEREAASVPVSFLVRRREQRLVATQPIRKGERLGAHNLALRELDATFEDRGFGDLGEVEGKNARAFVAAGKPLTRSLVESPPLIRRGDAVKVLVRSGAVVVEASGTALRDAREGESLPVQLADSKKHLQAVCVDAGVVVHGAR